MSPREGRLRWLSPVGFHRLAWTEWGPADGAPVVCVHGLTRTGRDFDFLAAALAERGRRVLCPDMPGRGASDRLPDPSLYRNDIYAGACAHLLATFGDRRIDWVGTSMGGIIGMIVAAMPNAPIRRLVINDVGPSIPAAALARIGEYLGRVWSFPDLAAAEAHTRKAYAPFGALTDAQWRHLTETSVRPLAGGGFRLHYDPAIAEPFRTAPQDMEFWPAWEHIAAPSLVLRGEASDLLLPETAARMAAKPAVRVQTIPGCGHAPALLDAVQIGLVTDFLMEPA
ncbi:alpha/beta hydrolase [Elioraea tepidiphila]|uniref:alpha/beta fold hydrolase n=1 Tax=Elioraea tepidiphila TaxID=457934 RepID=UPI002FD8BD9B